MRRIAVASLAVTLLAFATPLRAQVAMLTDSVASTPTAPDTALRLIRVSSRHLPFELRDIVSMNCTYLTDMEDVATYVAPYACMRRMTGTIARMDADSIVFVRHGRPIRLAMRDVQRVDRPAGRSAWRSVLGGVMGGFTGLVGSVMIGLGGAYGDNDAAFVATAATLTAGGAAFGAWRGGKSWAELPRPDRARVGP